TSEAARAGRPTAHLRAEGGLTAPVPADPGAEHALPYEHPAAVQPGGLKLIAVVPVPAPGLMCHVPLLEPVSPEHAGGAAVGAPLRPGKTVVCYPRQRHRRLTLERQRPKTLEERLPKRSVRLPQGVQEDAVRSGLLDQPDERLPVIARLTPGADIPGVVVDEDPEAQPLQIPNQGIQ